MHNAEETIYRIVGLVVSLRPFFEQAAMVRKRVKWNVHVQYVFEMYTKAYVILLLRLAKSINNTPTGFSSTRSC